MLNTIHYSSIKHNEVLFKYDYMFGLTRPPPGQQYKNVKIRYDMVQLRCYGGSHMAYSGCYNAKFVTL